MNLRFPAAVFSDLHLGHPASHLSKPEMLFPAIDEVASLVFNGDTSELINLRRKRDARAKLHGLLDYCDRRRLQVVQLTGNHDPVASNLHALDLLGGQVFVTHGDALHPDVAPWSRESAALRVERLRLETCEGRRGETDDPLQRAKKCALVVGIDDPHGNDGWTARVDMAARFAYEPWRAVRAARYWSLAPSYAAAFRSQLRKNASLMLIGHSHRPGIWRMPGWTLVNTGSFQPLSAPLRVLLNEDGAIVHRLRLRGERYQVAERLAEVPLAGSANRD